MPFVLRDKLCDTQEEIETLQRLLNEAIKRKRLLAKQYKKQSWIDWLWEMIGY